ncbi:MULTISPECIES: FxSxx-COOH system tetratricopeptide repeat protein [unclassified Streptomyces]|uniref:FxSxx-COOH system tetratricopeptide repeat protein n=1 Tax=unclassified Streptomyces TaxID=2593676 RepID=UPI0016608F0F|nr:MULTISPECIES: FxSxx-COOH system tetratricopeptide repeat protein [unclassified Streptomyces]MBD0707339.1 tetratricopeptide repeat protein [Streptomyces sp. CBMA291]MBD0715209.1 tetratricopeptide repeat protein [Streptomyces sp. CBMA370]
MAEQAWPTGGAPRGITAPEHVLVVFPGYHRPWATWIGQRLDLHGVRTTPHRWDPPREVPLEDSLGDLLLARGQVLLVLNDWFFELGPRPAGEWNDVLRGFVAAHADRFAAVNLTNRPLLPATAVLEPVSLWGVGEDEAEARLLARLGVEARRGGRRIPPAALARYPDTPPEIWGEVPRRNPRFTGRDDLLTALQERLMDAERGHAACTLLGMSGIGKTQIAAEYAHRFSPDYDAVWWVSSDDRNVQRDRFGELAVELHLPVGSEPGERIRAVREALRRGDPHGRWLVVFDGWDDIKDAAVMLPQGTGHVLVTSRNRAWGEHTQILEVGGFDRAESTGYLMRRAPHLTAAEADEVATEFGDVPLPLVQAAAWLGESGMEAPEYLRMVRDGRLSTVDDPTAADGMPNASLTSWSILINRLRRSQPQAVEILSLCASFAPGRIPIGLVRAYPQADLPEDLHWMATDRPAWTRALDTLVNYSVLTRETRGPIASDTGPSEESIHMHRLVHDIVSRLTDGTHRAAHRKAVRALLAEADPGAPMDSRHWPRYAELLPHLEPSGALESRSPRMQTAVLNCLRYCYRSGEFKAGTRLAERIRHSWSGFMDPVAAPMLSLTTQEGNILRASGRFREAQLLDSAALDRLRAQSPRNEHAELIAQSATASNLRYLGQYAEAETLQRRLLDESHRLLGENEFMTLLARHNLGVSLRLLGRYQEAYDLDAENLARRETILRPLHANTLNSGNSLAHDLRLLGRYRDALVRQEASVRLHIQVLGAQHPQTLSARAQLSLCRRREGGTQQDIGGQMEHLLEQIEQVHGRSHHTTLTFINNYASFLREHGDLDHARELTTEAEAGFRSLLGPAHPVATGMVANTGLVLQASGERSDALALLESALAGLTATLGPDHPWVLGCALNTAAARNFNGRVADATELSRETLRRARRVLGGEHPLTLSCQIALAADLRGIREVEEAGKVEEDALLTLTRSLGAQHPHTLSARQRNRPYWDFEAYLG